MQLVNLLKNGNFNQGLDRWLITRGEPLVTGSFLQIRGKHSCQVRQSFPLIKGHQYYFSVILRMQSHIRGTLGAQINGKFGRRTGWTIGMDQLSFGTQEYSQIVTASDDTKGTLYVGSIFDAECTGVIKSAVVYDLTEAYGEGNEPTLEVFNGIRAENSGQETEEFLNLSQASTDSEKYEEIFVEEMNEKCRLWHLDQTVFFNPHGLAAKQLSTAHDLMRLLIQALSEKELLRVWGCQRYSVMVTGPQARLIACETTVTDRHFSEEYQILGGKTGTLGGYNVWNVAMLVADRQQRCFLVVALDADSSEERFADCRQLIQQLVTGGPIEEAKFSGKAGAVMEIKAEPIFWTNNFLPEIKGYHLQQQLPCASLTKLMTALILLENVKDLNEQIALEESDLIGGSGPKFYDGDRVSFRDALFLMMLPSSNTVAQAVSRTVGEKLWSLRNKK